MHDAARCEERAGRLRDRSQEGRYRCSAETLHGSPAGRRNPASRGCTLQAVCAERETRASASSTTERWRATPFSTGRCALEPGQSFTMVGDTLDGTKHAGTPATFELSVCLQLAVGGGDH